jgi:PPM family protein phosphatase
MDQSGKTTLDEDTQELTPQPAPSSFIRPASSLVEVEIGAESHLGLVRDNNEDHYLVARFKRLLETLNTNVEDGILEPSFEETGYAMLVADGMGGMVAGEVASRMALVKLVELSVSTPDWIMKLDERENITRLLDRLTQRIRQVDDVIRAQADDDYTLAGMGTTLTLGVSLGANLLVAHVGDSRAYLMREGRLHQLTRDDTLAQEMIDAGIVKPDDVSTHAMRHVLTAALGSGGTKANPHVQRLLLHADDQLLLCTDGLTGMVKDETIASVLNQGGSARDACKKLVQLALDAGGHDNITVVLGKYRFPK